MCVCMCVFEYTFVCVHTYRVQLVSKLAGLETSVDTIFMIWRARAKASKRTTGEHARVR